MVRARYTGQTKQPPPLTPGNCCVPMYGVVCPVQVEAVMQSVAAHRASVPAVISKALEQQLQDMRPPGCAGANDAAAPAGERHMKPPALQLRSVCGWHAWLEHRTRPRTCCSRPR